MIFITGIPNFELSPQGLIFFLNFNHSEVVMQSERQESGQLLSLNT